MWLLAVFESLKTTHVGTAVKITRSYNGWYVRVQQRITFFETILSLTLSFFVMKTGKYLGELSNDE
jgi:hypothetical protein